MNRSIQRLLLLLTVTSGLTAVLMVPGGAAAEPAERQSLWEWSGVRRVVAVGDLHGSYDKFVQLLKGAGLVDSALRWTGGEDHLVVVGDFLDRGPGGRALMDLLRCLETESAAAGGRTHVLLGNHEVMNLLRDTRYVSAEAYQRFAADESSKERQAAWRRFLSVRADQMHPRVARDEFNRGFPPGFFARQRLLEHDGEYGRWLLRLPAAVKIDGVVFVHGGLTEAFATLGVDGLNRRVLETVRRHLEARRRLQDAGAVSETMDYATLLETMEELAEPSGPVRVVDLQTWARTALEAAKDPVLGAEGPLWYRGNAWEDERIERQTLERSLELFGARALVVAHSYTGGDKITSRFHGRLFRIDHGIRDSRRPLALVVERGEALVLDPATRQVMRPIRELPAGMSGAVAARREELAEDEVVRLLARAEVVASRELGRGSSRPRLVVLADQGRELRGLFKASATLREEAASDRYQHEVAAYRLDRRIGLGLVPPTVVREIDGQAGSLQRWVEGAVDREAADAYGLELQGGETVDRQLARAALFDALIGLKDRQPADILRRVQGDDLFLIDHSRAFSETLEVEWRGGSPPPELAAALASLDRIGLRDDLGDLLTSEQIDAILARRDQILAGRAAAVAVTAGPAASQ